MLIWGRPGYQTMMTGASDPVSFFVKFKTETYGTAKLVKTSEDGIVSGITFHISGTDILGNEVNEEVTTGENGQIEKKLLPGTYLVKELPVNRYVTPSAQYVTIESGQTSSVHFSNILKKFRVHVVKSDADTGNAQGDATLAGAAYGIFRDGELIDTYTTGPDGSFMTRYYVCGDGWTIREIEPSTGYLLNETIYEVGASPSLYEVELNTTENQVTETVIYGSIQLVKHTDDLNPDVPEGEKWSLFRLRNPAVIALPSLPTCLLAAIMSRNAQPTAPISFRIRNIRLSLSMLVRKPPWYRSLSMKARLFPMNFSVGV
ncbi:MAG: collagen binding domain-containing protein [[Ruminococcus] torques]